MSQANRPGNQRHRDRHRKVPSIALSLPGKDIMTVTAYALCTLRT